MTLPGGMIEAGLTSFKISSAYCLILFSCCFILMTLLVISRFLAFSSGPPSSVSAFDYDLTELKRLVSR